MSLLSVLSIAASGQSPIYFSSGHYANPGLWPQNNSVLMGTIVGTNIHTTTANNFPNSYFRFYSATAGGTTYEPNGGSDILLTANSATPTSLQVTGSGKAYYIAPINNTNSIVFKTDGSGSPGSARVMVFEITGTPVTVTAVAQAPAAASVFPGQAVTVTATTSAALPGGQGVFLRYAPNGNYAASVVLNMTNVSGNDYATTIPASVNTAGTTQSFYVFTSGGTTPPSGANSDLATINLNNNGGSNYSYTVLAGWTTANPGNWSAAATWTANAVPPVSPISMGAVNIGHNVTLDQNSQATTLNINAGTLTASGTSTLTATGTATIASGAFFTNSSANAANISFASFTIQNGGTYTHDAVGSSAGGVYTDFPGTTRTFGTSSYVVVTKWANGGTPGVTSYLPNNMGNVTINIATMAGGWNQRNNIVNIYGTLTIQATGGQTFNFHNAGSSTLNIFGSFIFSGGTVTIASTGSGSNTYITGGLSISGTANLNNTGEDIHFVNPGAGNMDVTNTSGTFRNFYVDVSRTCNFTGSQQMTIGSSGSLTINGISTVTNSSGVRNNGATTVNGTFNIQTFFRANSTMNINSGATVNFLGESYVDDGGTGSFLLNSGSTIGITSANGINSAGATGNVRTTTRTFNTGATYIYQGTSAQVTGIFTLSTASTMSTLTINNSLGVTLSAAYTVSTALNLQSGNLTLAGFNLTISAAAPINGSPFSATKMIVADGAGYLIKNVVAGSATILYPIGDDDAPNSAQYSPVNITLNNTGLSGTVGFNVTDAADPNVLPSAVYITRYWSTYSTGINSYTWTGSFTYTAVDVVAILPGVESDMKLNLWNAAPVNAWEEYASSSAGSNVVTVTSGPTTGSLTTSNHITPRVFTQYYYYRSNGAGTDWNTAANWDISVNSSFTPFSVAAVPPSALNSLQIWIQNGHTINVATTGITGDDMLVDGTLNMNTGSFTLKNGTAANDLTISTAGTLNIASTFTTVTPAYTSAAGSNTIVNGYFKTSVLSAYTTFSGTATVGASATFENAANGGTIIPATWTSGTPGALCYITGNTSGVPGGLNQTFFNFTWNTTQTAQVGLGLGSLSPSMAVAGDMTIMNTSTFELRLFSPANGGTLPVAGKLLLQGGTLALVNASVATAVSATPVLTVTGLVNATGGKLIVAGNNTTTGAGSPTVNANGGISVSNASSSINLAGSSSSGTINIKADLTISNGTIIKSGGGTGTVNFVQASGAQAVTVTPTALNTNVVLYNIGDGVTTNTVNLSSDFIINNSATATLKVFDKATLNCGTSYKVTGNTFTLNAGGTLGIGSPFGIFKAVSGNFGNIQTTTRNFNNGATYWYNGTANQSTGDGLPSNTSYAFSGVANTAGITTINLIIDNTGNTVTLTNNNTFVDQLSLKAGLFAAGTNQTINITDLGTVTSTGGNIVSDATGGTVYCWDHVTVNGSFNLWNVTIKGDNIEGGLGDGINFVNNATIINALQIDVYGAVTPNSPTFATGSTLIYNSGGTYNRSIEWGQVTPGSPGYPWHVLVQNNTTVNLGVSIPPNLEIGGNLTLGNTTNWGVVDMNTLTIPLKVHGNLVIGNAATTTSHLKLSTVAGGDLYLYGDFTRYNGSFYTDNNRAIYFKGTTDATVNTPGITITPGVPTQYFSYARIDKTNGTEFITLNCPVGINQEITFTKGIINSTSTNLLVIASTNAGAVIGGSILSFVNGPMKRYTTTAVAGAYSFPVGKTGTPNRYKGMTLTTVNNLASGSDFTGEYFYMLPPTVGNDFFSSVLLGIVNIEYWQLDRNTGTTTGKVTLPYVDPTGTNWRDVTGAPTSPNYNTNVAVIKRSTNSGAGTWDFTSTPGNFSSSSTPPEYRAYNDAGDIISREVTTFGPFTNGFAFTTILPVQLLQFDGRLVNGDGRLAWKVATTKDLKSFELEHSADGLHYVKLGEIQNNGSTDYQFLHLKPGTGTHYYRLIVKEDNGKTFYSNIVLLLNGNAKTHIIGLRQTILSGEAIILIFSGSNQSANATVVDALGRRITSGKTKLQAGLNQWKLETGVFTKGLYFITIITADGEKQTLRFIKE